MDILYLITKYPWLVILLLVVPSCLMLWRGRHGVKTFILTDWQLAAEAIGLKLCHHKEHVFFSDAFHLEGAVPGGTLSARSSCRMEGRNVRGGRAVQPLYVIVGKPDHQVPTDFVAELAGDATDKPSCQTYDYAFDDRVCVGGTDEHEVRRYLTPTRRAAVLNFFASAPVGSSVASDGIHVSRDYSVRPGEPLSHDLVLVKALLAALHREGPDR